MASLDIIKSRIKYLYENNPDVHINISITYPKVNMEDEPAKIIGVYKNVFRIEENSCGTPKQHTLQYTDVFVNKVEIRELKLN